MASICVFCGASVGARPEYAQAARELGQALVARDLELVYGGGNIGLMGVLAEAVLEAGGKVIGVIPQGLVDRELVHRGLTELHIVETMHQRKALMADRADLFAALPGGFGTADELFEILTWAQLGIHSRPIGLLNVVGYFDPLLVWLDSAVCEQLLHPRHRQLLLVASEPAALLEAILTAPPAPPVSKWVTPADR